MSSTPLSSASPKGARGKGTKWPLLGIGAVFLLVFLLLSTLGVLSTSRNTSIQGKQHSIFDTAMAISDPVARHEYLGALSFNKICFMHVPKTGGTNLAATGAWKAVFKTEHLRNTLEQANSFDALAKLDRQLVERAQVTRKSIGHTKDPQGCMNGKVVTVIRDPMERMVSAFHNSKKTAETCDLDATDWSAPIGSEGYALTCDCCGVLHFRELVLKFNNQEDLGLLDFLVEEHMPKNQMSRQLLGWSIVDYCEGVADPTVEDARMGRCRQIIRSRLLEHFIILGFSEHYESLEKKFADLFDVAYASVADQGQVVWDGRKAVIGVKDYAGLPQRVPDLTERERERLLEWTHVDRILYEEAIKIWEPQFAGTEPWLQT